MAYKDLLGPDGTENNMGGTAQIVYYGKVSDIQTYAAPAQNATNPYVHTQPFVMKTGKKFYQLYTTLDTSQLDFGEVGEFDGKSFKPELKMFYPGLTEDWVQFINDAKNDKFVFIVPLPDGKMIQIGTDKFFAYVMGLPKTGQVSGRGKGSELTVMSYQPNILIYAAAVPLTAAA